MHDEPGPIPVVTDHAVVRFLQRHCGFEHQTVEALWRSGVDVDEVREMISTIVASGIENGAEGVTWRDLRFILRGVVVVTVLTREQFYQMHGSLVVREGRKRADHLRRVATERSHEAQLQMREQRQ